jgi:uracil-DNA glycosylase family 4
MSTPALADSFAALNAEIVACERCERLVAWRREVATNKRAAFRDAEYWGKPVVGFGDRHARILIVGLAPGAHGSNRTGRMFTGDASGDFLYRALYEAGYASQPFARDRDDGLMLSDVYISAAVRCVPPQNRPTQEEIRNCLPYLLREIRLLRSLRGVVALGKIAFDAVLSLYRQQGWLNEHSPQFGHGAFYDFGSASPWVLASYHPSRQNTQTGRLTPAMFAEIWKRARQETGASGE